MNTRVKRTIQLVCATYISIAVGISCADRPTVYELLQVSYPGYSIQDPSVLSAELARVFNDDIETPTTVIADLDGNDLEDYAFLLRNHENMEDLFLVYLQTSKNEFEAFELERDRFLADYIEEVEPNVTLVPFFDDEKELYGGSLTLSYSAILGVHYGKSSRVDFWDSTSKTFKTIWTSD